MALPGETRVLKVGSSYQLKYHPAPPVAGALGEIGLSGRASRKAVSLETKEIPLEMVL